MSKSLNSAKVLWEVYRGVLQGLLKGDKRSLDESSLKFLRHYTPPKLTWKPNKGHSLPRRLSFKKRTISAFLFVWGRAVALNLEHLHKSQGSNVEDRILGCSL